MDDSLVTGYGRICMDCKLSNSSNHNYTTPRKTIIHRKRTVISSKPSIVRNCRFCSDELLLGENWTESRKNKCDYICRTCRSLKEPPARIKRPKAIRPLVNKKSTKLKKTAVAKKECPYCYSRMILRKNSNDGTKFWGCSKFPKCRGTRFYR